MDNILATLELLYPGRSKKILKQLQILIKEYKSNYPLKNDSHKPLFSEKDVILSCYPDHVQEKNIATFKTMAKFLNIYTRDIINRVYFLPFYPWSSDDGFAVSDYYKIKPNYGSWSDLRDIKKNFSLMFDCVFNHCSVEHKWFKQALLGQKKYQDYFFFFDKKINTDSVFRPRTSALLTKFNTKEGRKYVWTTFSKDQVDLNYANPEVFLESVKILLFYLSKGAEAFRLDAIAYSWKELNSTCFNLPQAHLLASLWRAVLKKLEPQAWLVAEAVLPNHENIEYFGNGQDQMHATYDFSLEAVLIYSFITGNSKLINKHLQARNTAQKQNAYLNLSNSHDGIHNIPREYLNNKQLAKISEYIKKHGGGISYGKLGVPYEFNISYPSAFASIEAFLASQAILLAIKGVPIIYFNNLFGLRNWQNGIKNKQPRAINREKFSFTELCKKLVKPDSFEYRTYQAYRQLLKTRTREKLFSPLAGQTVLNIHLGLLAIHRWQGKKNLVALINVRNKKIKINSLAIKKLLNKNSAVNIINKQVVNIKKEIILESYQILWLK